MFPKRRITMGGDVFRDEYSLAFDGTDDYISLPSVTYNIDGGTVSFTFWAKRNDTSVVNLVLAGHQNYKFISLHSNGNMYIEGNINNNLASAPIQTDTDWHHYAVVCSSGTVSMYEDGISLTMGDYDISGDLTITSISHSTVKLFKGNISEVAIYNSALTANQVKTIYNGREPYNHKEGVASGNLQAWYRMGDGILDHRQANGLIADQTDATLGSELITGFTNGDTYPFDTLTTSGRDISSAIETSGDWGGCASNQLNITAGEVYKCTFNLTYNSGDDTVRFVLASGATGGSVARSTTRYSNTSGINTMYFLVTATDSTSYFQIGTWHETDEINFSMSNVSLKKVGGNSGIMVNMDAVDFTGDTP